MARLFQALVVLGGSLAGCGGRSAPDLGRTDNERETTGSDADTAPSHSSAVVSSAMDASAVGSSAVDSSAGTTSPITAATTSVVVITVDDPGPTSSEPSDATVTDGSITLDPPPPPVDLPDGCLSTQWQCDSLRACNRGGSSCGENWTGKIESCPVPLREAQCQCGDTPAPTACDEGQVLTCLYGENMDTHGNVEPLHIACECLAAHDDCQMVCGEHSSSVGSFQRACTATPELVLCGGCIWAGILR